MKLKHVSVKLPDTMYTELVNLTIKRTNNENRLVNLSEIIREYLTIGLSRGK